MHRSIPGNTPERASPALASHQSFDQTYASPSFERLIRGSCRRFLGWQVHQDDLRQAAAIALWRSMDTYDPSLGTPLEHYASRAIRRAVAEEATKESRHWENRVEQAHGDPDADLDLDDMSNAGLDDGAELATDTVFDAVLVQQIDEWTATLPENLRSVYELRHVQGLSQAEVAREMGITQQRVSCLEQKLARLARADVPAVRVQ